MAMKANASAQGASFKNYVGVGSFRVLGVNPTKEEMEKFFGRSFDKEPEYLKDMVDSQDNNKPYKQLRVTYLIQADPAKDIDSIMSSINAELSAKMTDEFGDVDMYCLNYGYVTGSYQVADSYYRQADRNLGQDKSNFYKTHNIDRRQ